MLPRAMLSNGTPTVETQAWQMEILQMFSPSQSHVKLVAEHWLARHMPLPSARRQVPGVSTLRHEQSVSLNWQGGFRASAVCVWG